MPERIQLNLTLQGIAFILLHLLSLVMAVAYVDYDSSDDDQPSFLPRPSNVSFNRGETAVLVCGIENLGTKTVSWRRASDPNPLTIGEDVYVGDERYSAHGVEEAKEWRLLIRDLKTEDAGVYECQVSSRTKLINHILLRVNATARDGRNERKNNINHEQVKLEPVIPRHNPAISVSGTKYVEKGDPIHLVCNSTGTVDPPENLDWFKDGIKLSPDGERQLKIDKFHVRTTRTLVSVLDIMHSRMDDAGTYVCRSSNLAITSTKVHVLNGLTKNVRRTSATDTVEGVGDQGSDGHGYSESRGPDGGNHASSRCQASPVVIFFLCAMTFLARLSGVRTLR